MRTVELEDQVQQGAGATELGVEALLPLGGARSPEVEFEAFVRDSASALETTAYLLAGDRHRAQELTQQAFERVWRAWPRARQDPLPYARRVLVNLRVDHWRRRRRERLVESVPESSQASAEDAVVQRDELVRALMALPVRQRRIVVMRHLLDLSVEQVSTELGVTPGTVKASASRGLAALRVVLGEEER
ncbi:SigE family RNA polymerase sigma factor [Cellulosimicrobium cellulans]|uniref:SigE family RNA polymerase sigma factor n=1 Tax=Cellulosimicrobium cellulans TaxID=1710 RepID=UPI000848E7E9|nr:SigE family RNA polymerase sigma factor [Cellulosimicrobium cellulans]